MFVRVRTGVLHLDIILILEADQVAATATDEGAMRCSGDLNTEHDTVSQICCDLLELSLQFFDEGGFTAKADFIFRLLARPGAIRSWLVSTRTKH